MTLGNAGGVEAILNDRPLGSFGERGQVILSLLITRDGVSSVPGLSVNSPKDFPENRP
ncbi:MAG: hypothetical protein HZA19_05795 [Nitrospirae bacterium]|nr:hypothetical protein [Nitrospirota bacterium]